MEWEELGRRHLRAQLDARATLEDAREATRAMLAANAEGVTLVEIESFLDRCDDGTRGEDTFEAYVSAKRAAAELATAELAAAKAAELEAARAAELEAARAADVAGAEVAAVLASSAEGAQ